MTATVTDSRCTFTFRDARRCRMLRAQGSDLCPHHLRRWLKQNDFDPPAPRPLVAPGSLDNPWAVRRSLKQVFREMVDGNITPEQAKALAQVGDLLLIHTRRQPRRRPTGVQRSRAAAG